MVSATATAVVSSQADDAPTMQEERQMVTRLGLGLATAFVMAPALYAASVPVQAPSRLPWENLTQWAAAAICSNLGFCFGSMP